MRAFTMLLFLPLTFLPHAAPGAEPAQVYRGAAVLTVARGEIADADFVVQDGKILAVGKRGEVAIPDGAVVHHLDGKLVIPGLVDSHSHIGIYPKPSVEAHSDGNEMTGPVQAGIRAVDAIWPEDPGIRMALAGGVTTANIMPGSGNVIGGQTLYVKLRPGPISNMMAQPGTPEGGLKMANGENPKRAYSSKKQAPNTRMRLAALQREQFVKALDYRRKWQSYRQTREKARADAAQVKDAKPQAREPVEPERDLALETLVEVLDRKRTVHFHSHRADDIMTVVRLAEEFGFEVVVQHGTEAYKVVDELARRKIPVSMTIVDSPGGKPEVADLIFQEAAILEKAGVPIAINTDDSVTESRFLLRTASLAVRGGLSEAAALKALTLNPAAMLHLEGRIGSIEPGKDADFVVLSGRPFSVYTQVLQTFIEGRKRYDRTEGSQGNYGVGGFALADPSIRPRPAPLTTPPDGVSPAAPGGPEIPGDSKRLAIRAGLLYTVKGPPIRNGLVLVEDGKIRHAGRAEGTELPAGTPVLAAPVVTPGLIDAHTVVGVSGQLNDLADQDQDERSDPNQSDARILDSFNPAEPLLEFAMRQGVTVIQACPGPVNVIGGQAGIFHTHGRTVEAMTVRFPSAVVFQLGEVPKTTYPGKAPSTRMGTAALIRNALVAASNDRKKRQATKPDAPTPDRNLKHEALGLLLDKKVPAIFAAHRADDLATALRLKDEFGLEAQLSLATEAYLIADALAAAKVPVLVHPTMQRPGSPETFNTTLNNAGLLADRGIPVAITSGFESYVPKTRVLRSEAAIAMVNGLGYDRALKAITLDAARILKIDAEYGSLEPGKVADLVLYDGDPFEHTTHVTHVVLSGKVVYDQAAEAKRLPLQGRISGLSSVEPNCCLGY